MMTRMITRLAAAVLLATAVSGGTIVANCPGCADH